LETTDRYIRFFKLEDKAVVGQPADLVMPVPAEWQEIHARAQAGETLTGQVRQQDGDYVLVNDWFVCPWYRPDDSIGGIITCATTSTTTLLAEIAAGRMQIVLQETPDFIIYLSADGVIEYHNHQPDRIGGDWLSYASPLNLAQHEQALQQARQRDESVRYEVQDDDGRFYHIRLTAVRHGESITGFVVHAVDITAQRQAEAERQQHQARLIEAGQRALRDLSTPIIPVMPGILIVPLIGQIDDNRGQALVRQLLAGLTQHRARVVILDITGVPAIDRHIVYYLHRVIQSARLKGTHTILTGIAPAIAETMIEMNIGWQQVETLAELQQGLQAAQRFLRHTNLHPDAGSDSP
nr:STAS domain-containing protein [Anaerolineae bacterium]